MTEDLTPERLAQTIGVGATWAVKDRRWWKTINSCDAHRDDDTPG